MRQALLLTNERPAHSGSALMLPAQQRPNMLPVGCKRNRARASRAQRKLGMSPWVRVGRGCNRSLFVSLSTESAVIDTTEDRCLLVLYSQQGHFHMVSGDSTDHEHLPGLWCQHVPWVLARSPVAVWATDTNMISGSSTDYGYSHSYQ